MRRAAVKKIASPNGLLGGGTLTITGSKFGSTTATLDSYAPVTFLPSTGGDLIITGTNFVQSPAPTVTIEGTSCPLGNAANNPVQSVTRIACRAPSSLTAGKYDVVVTNGDGQVDLVPIVDSVDTVSGTVTIVSPNQLRGGGTLTITGAKFGTAGATGRVVTVGGGVCPTVTVVSDTTMTCIFPALPASTAAKVVVTIPAVGFSTATTVSPAPTVTIGGVSCPLGNAANNAAQSTTKIYCIAPASLTAGKYTVVGTSGDGYVLAAAVDAIPYQGTNQPSVTLLATTVTTTPAKAATSANKLGGGDLLTITGTNVGSSSANTVIAGGDACTDAKFITADTTMTCVLPAAVVVTVPAVGYTTAADVLVTYAAAGTSPVFGTFTLTNLVTRAATRDITIAGTGLSVVGTNVISPVVTVGGDVCTWKSNTAIQIICTAPAKDAGSYPVLVVNSDVGSALSTVNLTCQGATATSLPSVTGIFTTTTTAAKAATLANYLRGGDVLTITGTHFGTLSTATNTITVGGDACTNAKVTTADTQMTCTLPAKAVATTSAAVIVTIPSVGYSTAADLSVTYKAQGE
eukprot:gene9248-16398_t